MNRLAVARPLSTGTPSHTKVMFWQTNVSYQFGPFRIDARERQLLRNGEIVPLRPKVCDVLLALLQNNGRFLSKEELMKLVWGDTVVEEGNLARNISTLRSALGEQPREAKYIETVPWRGYRFVANVKRVQSESSRRAITSVAVLRFINVRNDQDLDYLAEGIPEALINNLSQLSQLKVLSRNSAFRYNSREIDVLKVGRELRVEAVLTGRITIKDDVLSISVELVDARDDSHIWGAQYTRKTIDISQIQPRIAAEITRNLRVQLSVEERKRLPAAYTRDVEAYHLYLKGRYHFNKLTLEGVERAIDYLKQAVATDPDYALAYVALGDSYNYCAKPSEAREAMTKALELDQTLGEAHASLGFFKFIYDWDFPGAEQEFRDALKFNPNYAEAHHWLAIYLGNMGRHDDAAVEAKLAVELDPLSLLMNMTPGLTAYLARDYKRAIEQLLNVVELDAGFPAAHSVLGNAYLQQGSFEKAIAEYEKALAFGGTARVVELSIKALIAHAHAKFGNRKQAVELLTELNTAYKETEHTAPLVWPHFIAEIYAASGEMDLAFKWLNQAYDQHDMQMVSLNVNPTLDPLRDDSRFADLLQRMGLAGA